MSFAKRLNLVIKELGYNKNSFSVKLGYENNTLIYEYANEKGKDKKPGFDFFEKLIQAKIGINIEWLVTGKGEMFTEKSTHEPKLHTVNEKGELAKIRSDIRELQKKAEDYRERIEILENERKKPVKPAGLQKA